MDSRDIAQACLYEEAMKVTCQIEGEKYTGSIVKLQAAIKYGEEDLPGAKSLVDQSPEDDPDAEVNRACLLYKVRYNYIGDIVVGVYNALILISSHIYIGSMITHQKKSIEELYIDASTLNNVDYIPKLNIHFLRLYYRINIIRLI